MFQLKAVEMTLPTLNRSITEKVSVSFLTVCSLRLILGLWPLEGKGIVRVGFLDAYAHPDKTGNTRIWPPGVLSTLRIPFTAWDRPQHQFQSKGNKVAEQSGPRGCSYFQEKSPRLAIDSCLVRGGWVSLDLSWKIASLFRKKSTLQWDDFLKFSTRV